MSTIAVSDIKQLRERTGVGMAKCKKALEEAGGNIELAIENLRKSGIASAVKKEGRQTNEGAIAFEQDGDRLALFELSAETDFVVNNEGFRDFLTHLTKQVLRDSPQDIDALLSLPYISDTSLSVEEQRSLIIQSIGENIQPKRFLIKNKEGNASFGIYSHMGGKIVSVVTLKGEGDLSELANDLAMQVAASSPEYVRPEEIPAENLEKERDIARSQMQGKPENIIENIIEGKLKAYYKEVCLLHQPFFKEPKKSVQDVVDEWAKKLGTSIEVLDQLRWSVK